MYARELLGLTQTGVYTPTWTSSGTQPTLGNGLFTCGWVRIGQWVVVGFRLGIGSTTTLGTGTYSFTLPFPARQGLSYNGSGMLFDQSAGITTLCMPHINAEGAVASVMNCYVTGTSPNDKLAATVPYTWANLDQMVWTIAYPTV